MTVTTLRAKWLYLQLSLWHDGWPKALLCQLSKYCGIGEGWTHGVNGCVARQIFQP